MDAVRARGLGKDYGDTSAVASLDLRVERGQIFGLLGPNGAGKTTTISMMCGVVTPSRGKVEVAGHDIASQPFAARQAIGLVPQSLAIYDELTGRQNLAFFGSLYRLGASLLAERIEWALGVVGLIDRAGERVERFSGGMKRRLNLAAGLLHRPEVLICDEPTVGVDPQSRNHIFETLRRLNRENGMTVIYTSHYMEEVEALCQRVAIMDRGRLIAEDTVEGLLGEHAGGALVIDVDGDADGALSALLSGPAREHDPIPVLEGSRITLIPAGPLAPYIAAVEGVASIRSVRSAEADLETVFLTLTGHSLRDDE